METNSKQNDNDALNDHLLNYTLLITFHPSDSNYSCNIPPTWSISKLKQFIRISFDDLIRNSKFSILYKGQRLIDKDNEESKGLFLKDILNTEPIHHIHIVLNTEENNSKSNLKFKSRDDLLHSKHFDSIEFLAFNDYFNLTYDNNNNDTGFLCDYSSFPLTHPCITQRIQVINSNNTIEQLRGFEVDTIEQFPMKDYFKIGLLIRMFSGYFVLKNMVNDWNTPLVLAGFLIYYYMEVVELVKEHYRKKIAEYQLTNEEANEVNEETVNAHVKMDNTGNERNERNKDKSDDKKEDNSNSLKDPLSHQQKYNNIERVIEELVEEQDKKHHQSISSQNSIIENSNTNNYPIEDEKEEPKEKEQPINGNVSNKDPKIKTDANVNANTTNAVNPNENKK